MATFINKKQQVIDLKLTLYGHYLFSIGRFAPKYYTFMDDNVIYDTSYTGRNEEQSAIHERIKNETPYLETLTLFEEIENNLQLPSDINKKTFYAGDLTAMMEIARKDNFKFTSMIGDAYLDGTSNAAPAWKVVVLAGQISSSMTENLAQDLTIPQINIDLNYIKKVVDRPPNPAESKSPRKVLDTVGQFGDNKYIQLIGEDALIYFEEANTELLTENFEIEVFEIFHSSSTTQYTRKYFDNIEPQIVNGMMVRPTPTNPSRANVTNGRGVVTLATSSVEYYFNVVTDYMIDAERACRAMEEFNKKSYYIDLDFDCESSSGEGLLMDIYGKVTEPDICP
tara:strand:+ start:8668 stop:9684 length:1017 start_codon:yes stop_codon:yes gene_type:complete